MGKKNNKKLKEGEKTFTKTEKNLLSKRKLQKINEADIVGVIAKLETDHLHSTTVSITACTKPSPRSGFSLVSYPEKDLLILYGGEFYNGQEVSVYNDLFFYNTIKDEWKQVNSLGPTPRSGHQMVSICKGSGQLWLFGGEYTSPSQMQFYHYNDLWMMNLKTKGWEKFNAVNGPSPRSGHRMVATNKKIIVFGGFHDNNCTYKYLNDLHMFSLETYTWLEVCINSSVLPPPRSGCGIAVSPDGKILIWGGYSKSRVKKYVDRGMVHTDMYALVPDKVNSSDRFKWCKLKAGGYKPLPRSSMGCTIAPNGKAYCFGGVMDIEEDEEDIQGHFSNDLLEIDLLTQTWRLLNIGVKARSAKKNCNVNASNLKKNDQAPTLSTDGVFLMTVANTPQSPISPKPTDTEVSNSFPSPRMCPGMCVCKSTLYVFGGLLEDGTKQITLNDFYALDLHKLSKWKVLIPNNASHDWIDSDISSVSSEQSEDPASSSDEEMDTE